MKESAESERESDATGRRATEWDNWRIQSAEDRRRATRRATDERGKLHGYKFKRFTFLTGAKGGSTLHSSRQGYWSGSEWRSTEVHV